MQIISIEPVSYSEVTIESENGKHKHRRYSADDWRNYCDDWATEDESFWIRSDESLMLENLYQEFTNRPW